VCGGGKVINFAGSLTDLASWCPGGTPKIASRIAREQPRKLRQRRVLATHSDGTREGCGTSVAIASRDERAVHFREEAVMQSPVARAALLRIGSRRLSWAEDGQDLLEYGLLAALIALVAIASITAVGQTIYTVFWKSIETNF
jgi:Flp pilus assembly pilin Flp